MKIIKFRIKHYKSIIDSGDCYFSEKLTILAGKNESGKTSVLEALQDFHQGKTILDTAKPIDGEGVPEISITFSLAPDELNNILKTIDTSSSSSKETLVSFTKKYPTNSYVLDTESRDKIGLPDGIEVLKKQIDETSKKISNLLSKPQNTVTLPKFDEKDLQNYKTEIFNFKTQTQESSEIVSEIANIEKAIEDYETNVKLVASFTEEFVKTKLPNFILFSSFDDEFPKSIPISSLSTNEWAQDLECVSNFSIAKMSSSNQQEQINHENAVNVDFTEKFDKYWTQDKIKLQIKKDGTDINFWIVEKNKLYYPSQRSKGQQWYLSFYVKIVARLQEDKPDIILIDEPGLYLHAKAQKDLLGVLLTHTNENPVIFSTHSPYLITEDNLENVRLIEKTENGTSILGKIHAHPTADKETLTPILTAIGLGINDSITNLDQKNNVVVEGPEDTFYLRGFKELEKNDLKINFINGGGSSNMGIVGSILEGWGANVIYLYDNDQGGKDGKKKLKAWKVLPEAIKNVVKSTDATIVDIFDPKDFKTYVLDDSDLDYTSSNSEYIKGLKPRPDKVLLARMFLQKIRTNKAHIHLEETTKENITALFKEIEFNK